MAKMIMTDNETRVEDIYNENTSVFQKALYLTNVKIVLM